VSSENDEHRLDESDGEPVDDSIEENFEPDETSRLDTTDRESGPQTRRGVRDEAVRERRRARWRKAAPWVYAGGGVLIVALAFLGWAGSRVFVVYQEVTAVQSEAKALASSASKLKLDGLESGFSSIAAHVYNARAVAEEPIWQFMSGVPGLGQNLVATKELVGLLGDALTLAEPLVEWAANFEFSSLSPTNGALPVPEIRAALEQLQDFGASLPSLVGRAEAIDTSGTLGPIRDGAETVAMALSTARDAFDDVKDLSQVLPTMLGEDGPRTYVVAFINSAELRSLGGTALSFAQLTIDEGKISLDDIIPAGSGGFPKKPVDPIVPVPVGFEALLPGTYGRAVPNLTIRPSFASAAEQIVANFKVYRGTEVDDVIGVDALALKSIVDATGSFELSTGDVVDASNVVDLLLNEVYIRYQSKASGGANAQDAVYSETVSEVFGRIMSGKFNVARLFSNISQDMDEGHVSFWSSDPDIQAAFTPFGADNGLPVTDEDVERVGIYFVDYIGSKLGYYLESDVVLGSAVCGPDIQQRRVAVTLTNTLAPEDVKSVGRYVRGANNAPGLERIVVLVYAPPGSTFLGATLDGQPATTGQFSDDGHPVARYTLDMLPGESRTLVVDYQSGMAGQRPLQADLTPTIKGTTVTSSGTQCQLVGARQVYTPPAPPPQPGAPVPEPEPYPGPEWIPPYG
jgi:hypothetical protein